MASFFLEQAWLIPLLPILAALIITFVGHKLPQGGASLLIAAIVGSLAMSVGAFGQVVQGGEPFQRSWEWLSTGSHTIDMGFLVDNLSSFMALLVSLLVLLIVIYSWGYMGEEGKGRRRYYAEVGLFAGGMLGTVLADNFLLMFLFWEIMGLCSYLLIGYWFRRPSAAAASLKAFLVTRVGDVMLLVGIVILFVHFGTFDYREIFEAVKDPAAQDTMPLLFAALMIFGGAVGKSAQFPLHAWLPDAMEGPTTVSALIHAATMVKAGVFLVARSFPVFVHTPDVFTVVAVIGGFTAFYAATMALVMYDIKRVLAYSTLSQLGYMFLGLGAGGLILVKTGSPIGYVAALFHLMNHAFFKAGLFLGAGSVGHAFHHAANPYDFRQMGGLHRKMPVTSWVMLICSVSIAGIPPLAGFWSKDEILAAANTAGGSEPILMVLWGLAVLTAFMTAFYMFRMWFSTFAGEPRSEMAEHAHESPKVMLWPISILAFFALFSGLFFFVPFGGFGGFEPYMAHDLESYTPGFIEVHAFHASEFLVHLFTSPLTWLSIAVAAAGVALAWAMYVKGSVSPERMKTRFSALHNGATRRWYLNDLTVGTGRFVGVVGGALSALIDRYVIDGIVNGLARGTTWAGGHMRTWQTGVVTTYAATVIVSVSIVLILLQYVFPFLGW
ncbi:MAG: NADH-quinone oxidoreductase subunit L [Euryarchaeota archaeon]|nr:NADH-quinone oxidoreductase subunit L [Euryarchaeota archaeon]